MKDADLAHEKGVRKKILDIPSHSELKLAWRTGGYLYRSTFQERGLRKCLNDI